MITKIIQLGEIKIVIKAYTSVAQACLSDFLIELPSNLQAVMTPSNGIKWVLHLVSSDLTESGELEISDGHRGLLNKVHRNYSSLGTGGMGSFFSIQSKPDQADTEFIHFISPNHTVIEERALLITHLAQIVKRWLMVNGNISLHASTIIRRGFGFLFLGHSGAGKSTVAMLSQTLARVLNDEKVFLTPEDDHYLLSRIPNLDETDFSAEDNVMVRNQSHDGSKIYLSGIFVLKQDTVSFLRPLPELAVAHALMNGFFELPRIFTLSHQEMLYALQILSQVARDIPAYELHFRKSPEFWKLIDEQFPD